MTDKDPTEKALFAFTGGSVLAEELDNTEKRNRLVSSGMTDKKSPEKSGFDFLGDFVLAEGLGGGAGQHRKAEPLG